MRNVSSNNFPQRPKDTTRSLTTDTGSIKHGFHSTTVIIPQIINMPFKMKAEALDNTQLYKGFFGPKAHMHLSWKETE